MRNHTLNLIIRNRRRISSFTAAYDHVRNGIHVKHVTALLETLKVKMPHTAPLCLHPIDRLTVAFEPAPHVQIYPIG
ncbi:MAG: hypothetical protein LUD76_10575 [Alistipes sp.]|nr:hypothetical protein [Alistipes sp.]